MAAKYTANPGILATSLNAVSLAAAAGAGEEFALSIPSQGTPTISWMTAFSGGNPASITVLLQASLDGTNWFTIDTSTSTTGEIRTITGSYRFIRLNNSAVTVGAGISLSASFVYSNTTKPQGYEDLIFCKNNMGIINTLTATEQVLQSVPLPSSLTQNGLHVAFDYDVQLRAAANTNSKTIRVRLGGLAGDAIGTIGPDTTSSDFYTFRGRFFSDGTTTLIGAAIVAQATGTSLVTVLGTAAVNLNVGTTLDVTSNVATATGDVVLMAVRVSLIRRS